MSRAQGSVGESGSGSNDHDGNAVIAEINANLFHTAIGDKWCDRVTDGTKATHRQTRGHPDHIRLGHATIVKSVGAFRFILIEETVADVS